MADMDSICADLEAETAALTAVLDPAGATALDVDTPADGWTVRDQITHLAYFDRAALTAATDPERFAAETAELMKGGPDQVLALGHDRDVVSWWRDERSGMIDVFRGLDPKQRIPWYGPAMSAMSFA